jgi:hypothetical protein
MALTVIYTVLNNTPQGVMIRKMTLPKSVGTVACTVLLSTASHAYAESNSKMHYFDSVALFAGQGVHHNLQDMPKRIVAGNLDWGNSYLNEIGFRRNLEVSQSGMPIFRDTPLSKISHGYELLLAQHHGLQDNVEIGMAYALKTPDLWLGSMGTNFSSGVGLSYAFGTPNFEDGATSDPQKRYHLQMLLLLDLEWKLKEISDWSLVTRLHHRSGVYGLIAPRHVGSNFLAVSIRYSL